MTTAVHPLTVPEAAAIVRDLHRGGIDVGASMDAEGTLCIWPADRTLTLLEEVRALAPFIRSTDSRIAWQEQAP